ncbi:MAG: lipopolysaccharide kinase InaA family protein [Desulfobacterota bacterium]|nr:lipopolysaccharide kinase InaA family protein [Thermodesulfobacteriota bacterium]
MTLHHLRWTVAPDYAARVTPDLLTDIILRNGITSKNIILDQFGRRITMLHTRSPALPLLCLKEYRVSLKQPLRALIRPYGFHEWRAAAELKKRGIPTPAPIALGVERRWGVYRRIFLATEAIPATMTLKEYIDKNGVAHVEELIDHFAAFAALMRKAGVMHRELHWGHVLIRVLPDGSPQFYLIGLDRVKIRTAAGRHGGISRHSLVSAALWGNMPTHEQMVFLGAYGRRIVQAIQQVYNLCLAWRERGIRILEKMMQRKRMDSCPDHVQLKKIVSNGRWGVAVNDCSGIVIALMENPDVLFTLPEATVIKDSRTTSSLILTHADTGPLFFKRYNRKSLWHRFTHLFKKSRARRVWHAAHAMIARNVPTPKPLLFLEERHFGMVTRSFFVSQAVAHCIPLDAFASGGFMNFSIREKYMFIRALAQRLRDMHDHGVRHGDLKAKNIVLAASDTTQGKIHFVDLDAVVIKKRLSCRDRYRDLERLSRSFPDSCFITMTHRLAFLKQYLGPVSRETLRDAWQTIQKRTEKQLKKAHKKYTKRAKDNQS